ncbi:DUF4129 domain-containing protein [Streptomyces sp. DSM 42041]|uniref:DUF4129 domain-containing protein n=1 Tax=Streptomyces hazeniae TaxID=3075538 RepID=A0ABU2NY53_9ACTN|nr:DUF4129 domain-containing protein [Streptomyces sp. DSM 42041]MDT0381664.1 DUF4129 domain-containing protein [Streptomyces sp. DSM 42041]
MPGGSAVARVLGEDAPPVTTPREPARRDAERELSEPVYHRDDPSLLEQAVDWVWEKLGELLGSAVDVVPGGAVGVTVLVGALVLLVAALWARLGTPHRTTGPARPALFEDRPRTADEHRATADAHAAAGRWSEAVREAMRALVRSLEERTLLDPRPGRTADEAAHEAGRLLPAQAGALRDAAVAFDEDTYAGRAARQDTYRRIRDLDETLRRTTPTLTGAGSGSGTGTGTGSDR